MNPDVDQLRANLSALKAARYGGVRKVRFMNGGEERETEFKTDAEMAAAIRALELDIATLEGTTGTRTVVVRSTKGW